MVNSLSGIGNVFLRLASLLALLAGCSGVEREKLLLGKQTYLGNCKVCHAQGLNGAPILGNAKMWSKRAPQGLDVLVEHASNGYGLMPAKGGNAELTSEEIEATVFYMLKQLDK